MKRFIARQKQIWQSLAKTPGFVMTVIVTMGLTLGALLCVLTLGYLLLFKPLPYPEQQSLYKVEHVIHGENGERKNAVFTYPTLLHLYKNQEVFNQAAMVNQTDAVLTSHEEQPKVQLSYVSEQWFAITGAKMALGRSFAATEQLGSNNPVAVLSYATWQNTFKGDRDILNKKVTFDGVSFSVVGVTAADFIEPELRAVGLRTGVWLPWDFNPASQFKARWGNIIGGLSFIGKLSNQYSQTQAEQKLTPMINDIWRQNVVGIKFFKGWSIHMELKSFQSVIMGDSAKAVFLLVAAVAGLVLIAAANIANLFMSRTAQQQKSLAIRAVVGANREDLFKGMFAESMQLMVLSMALALIVATVGFEVFHTYLDEVLPRIAELQLHVVTLLCAVGLVLALAFVFSYLGVHMIDYRKLNGSLQSSGKGNSIQVSKSIRQLLIAAQVSVASGLIFINLNLLHEALEKIETPLGFIVEDLVDVRLSYAASQWPEPAKMVPVLNELSQKLTELPQVVQVSRSSSPLGEFGLWALTDVASNTNYTPETRRASAEHFEMINQQVVEGNTFTQTQIRDSSPVMVINDTFARVLAPNGSAIGLKLSPGWGGDFTIIGVVKSIHLPGGQAQPMRVYTPAPLATPDLMVKLKPGQSLEPKQLIRLLKSIDSSYALYLMQSLEDKIHQRLLPQIAIVITSGVLVLLSLFLAAIGLYGILSYSTQMRKFEMGTRMAIGADGQALLRLLLKDNNGAVVSGILVSVLLIAGLFAAYYGELIGYVGAQLIWTGLVTLMTIGAIVFCACYIPLRSYINKPPIYCLRNMQ